MMGSGKTQAMYQMIRSNPDKSYMVVTPYLKTIQDAKDAGLAIREPEYKGGTKLDSLKYLLSHGYNIGCTHSLFLNVDDEVWDLICDSGYTLFIDEALDVVKPINDLIDDVGYKVKPGTAAFLLRQGVISVDEFCRVSWHGQDMDSIDYEYRYLEPYIKSGNVLCVNGQLFLWIFPPKIFEAFNDIYILSYLFKGTVFDAYLTINNFKYELGGVTGYFGSKEGLHFTEYHDDKESRIALKDIINIYDGMANGIGLKRYNLSDKWYKTASSLDLKAVRTSFNTFYKKVNTSEKRVMWTVYKQAQEHVCIDGAKYVRRLSASENKAMKDDPDCKDAALNNRTLSRLVSEMHTAKRRKIMKYLVPRIGQVTEKYNEIRHHVRRNCYSQCPELHADRTYSHRRQ